MANIKVDFTTGNFDLVVTGELNPEKQDAIVEAGTRWILQRDGASKAYVILAGVKNSKGNLALPEGFTRKSLEFSEDTASLVQEAFEKAMAEYGDFSVSVAEHVETEAVADGGQSAINLWAKAKLEPAVMAALGVEDERDDEAGLAAARAFLSSFRPERKAKAPKAA